MGRCSGFAALIAAHLAIFALAARHDETDSARINKVSASRGQVTSGSRMIESPGRSFVATPTSAETGFENFDCTPLSDHTKTSAVSPAQVLPRPDWLWPPEPPTESSNRPDRVATQLNPRDVIEEFDVARGFAGLVVPVTIGNREYRFLVDTGASICMLDTSLESLATKTNEIIRINGAKDFPEYDLPEMFLGKSRIPVSGLAICTDLKRFGDCTGQIIHGLLGMTFLTGRIIRIDFDSGKLTLLRTIRKKPDTSFRIFYEYNGTPCIYVQIAPNVRIPFEMDTGWMGPTSGGSLSSDAFKTLLRDEPFADTGKYDSRLTILGPETSRTARVKSLRLGNFNHTNLDFVESRDSRLSLHYLSRYVITFDFHDDRVYLERGARFDESELTARR